MKKTTVILAACLICLSAVSAFAGARLELSQDVIAFGTLKEGVVAREFVTLSNTGDAAVALKNVSSS